MNGRQDAPVRARQARQARDGSTIKLGGLELLETATLILSIALPGWVPSLLTLELAGQ